MIDKIQEVVADALYVDVEDAHIKANLIKDLGAESIDFLDIVFRLEKEFSIKIPKGDIEKKARGSLSEDEFAVNGRLTSQALEQLKLTMPEVDPAEIKEGLLVRDIPSLFTVGTLVRMVEEAKGGATVVIPAAEVVARA